MIFIATFRRKMQNVGGVSHRPLCPVGNVFPETAADLRIETHDVVLPQGLQAGIGPVAHGNHDRFLIHFELARFCEMQATLPCVAKAIWPLARITVALVPNIFFRPKPSLLA